MTEKPPLLKRYYDLRYRVKNWEKYLASNSASIAKNELRERIRRKVRQAFVNRHMSIKKISSQMLDNLVLLFKKGCVSCGGFERLELDHLVAVNHGGDVQRFMNFQVLCYDCHKRKTRAEQYRKTIHELESVRKQLIKEGYTIRE